MTLQSDIFTMCISMFSLESEDVRSAAAFAAGIAVISYSDNIIDSPIRQYHDRQHTSLPAIHY